MSDYNLLELAINAVSPSDVVLADDKGIPSVMTRVPKFLISDVIDGGSETTHPAFIVNGQEVDEIYISKYPNIVYNARACSIPLEDPETGIDFEDAMAACTAKGAGWHLMTRAEWAAIALWCRMNALMPKGNNDNGKDHADSDYEAVPASYDGDTVNRVLAGSGPLTWSHNGEQSGIFDLNGNVNEWLGGYRIVDGEIQVLANNDAADSSNSQLADSGAWMAILQDGTLVSPGTADTLKWDYSVLSEGGGTEAFVLNTAVANQQTAEEDGYGSVPFEALTAGAGVTVPELLKALALFPADGGDHGADSMTMRNIGERFGCAGGQWSSGAEAGVFCLQGAGGRATAEDNIGFRCAYVNLPA